MLAIIYDPSAPSDGSPSKQPEHALLAQEMRANGHHRGGGGLASVEQWAKTVRHLGDEVIITDGPFAESREALGGYYIVECSQQEALAYARRLPVDNRSWVQVRIIGILDRE